MSRGELGPSGLPLDRVVRRSGHKPAVRHRHRAPGRARLHPMLEVVLAIAVLVLVRP